MNDWNKVYFDKALVLAKDNRPGDALAILNYDPVSNSAVNRLKALCLWRLGYFKAAAGYSEDFSHYLEVYEQMLMSVEPLIKEKRYFEAIKTIDSELLETVIGNQIMGCIFCLAGMTKKGQECFFKALSLDRFNKGTISLIQSANYSGGDKFAELLQSIRYRLQRR